jgi:hypothetical protein
MLPGTWLAGATSPAEAARISWINRPGPQADPARGGTSGYYPFGPAPGVAAMTVLVSHVGTCYLGVNVDIDAVREPSSSTRACTKGSPWCWA